MANEQYEDNDQTEGDEPQESYLDSSLQSRVRQRLEARYRARGEAVPQINFNRAQKHELTEAELEKVERRRKQNREAAKRHREKKKSILPLENETKALEAENYIVETEIQSLTAELSQLQDIFNRHKPFCVLNPQLVTNQTFLDTSGCAINSEGNQATCLGFQSVVEPSVAPSHSSLNELAVSNVCYANDDVTRFSQQTTDVHWTQHGQDESRCSLIHNPVISDLSMTISNHPPNNAMPETTDSVNPVPDDNYITESLLLVNQETSTNANEFPTPVPIAVRNGGGETRGSPEQTFLTPSLDALQLHQLVTTDLVMPMPFSNGH